jgi:hypothetical protein
VAVARQRTEETAIPIIDRSEIRFDAEAIVGAVGGSLHTTQAFGPPMLRPDGVRFFPREGWVEFLYGADQEQQSVYLAAEPLDALLASYCDYLGIPLPRQAAKGIRVEVDGATLAFKIALPAMDDMRE